MLSSTVFEGSSTLLEELSSQHDMVPETGSTSLETGYLSFVLSLSQSSPASWGCNTSSIQCQVLSCVCELSALALLWSGFVSFGLVSTPSVPHSITRSFWDANVINPPTYTDRWKNRFSATWTLRHKKIEPGLVKDLMNGFRNSFKLNR